VRDIPVARSTAAIPPRPRASASAAHGRFSLSSITGSSAVNFVRISHSVATSALVQIDHREDPESRQDG
jgi:hypothetical protein